MSCYRPTSAGSVVGSSSQPCCGIASIGTPLSHNENWNRTPEALAIPATRVELRQQSDCAPGVRP
jgi:hypothetical protein